jgi:hypothetical protein
VIRAYLDFDDNTAAFMAHAKLAEREALTRAAAQGIAAIRATTGGYQIADIVETADSEPLEDANGPGVWLLIHDWRSLFFEWGTLGRRSSGRPLKRPRKQSWVDGDGNDAHRHPDALRGEHGVRAIHMLARGLASSRELLADYLREALERRIG